MRRTKYFDCQNCFICAGWWTDITGTADVVSEAFAILQIWHFIQSNNSPLQCLQITYSLSSYVCTWQTNISAIHIILCLDCMCLC